MKEEKVLETLNLKTFLENTKRGKTTRNARDFVLEFMILMWRTCTIYCCCKVVFINKMNGHIIVFQCFMICDA